jgi:hypothetical protein
MASYSYAVLYDEGMSAEYMTDRVSIQGRYRAAGLVLAGGMPARPLNAGLLVAR